MYIKLHREFRDPFVRSTRTYRSSKTCSRSPSSALRARRLAERATQNHHPATDSCLDHPHWLGNMLFLHSLRILHQTVCYLAESRANTPRASPRSIRTSSARSPTNTCETRTKIQQTSSIVHSTLTPTHSGRFRATLAPKIRVAATHLPIPLPLSRTRSLRVSSV